MTQNKTLEIFRKLTREQLQKLHDFVHSPYHNKNESLQQLFDYLEKLYPDFPEKKTTDAAILKHVKFKCTRGELHNKMTRLQHLAEDFLSFEYKHDPMLVRIGTLQAYKKLRLTGHFESLVGRLKKELDNNPYKDFNYWWHRYRLEDELVEGFTHQIRRTPDKTLAAVIESLDRFHAVKKLRHMCDQANLKNQIGNLYADKFKQETLDFISTADLTDPYLAAYSYIYLCFVEEDEKKADEYFYKLKKIVFSVTKIFPIIEIRALITYMEIHCSQQVNKAKKQFITEYIEIIRFKIRHGILLQEGQLSPLVYKNIVTCAIKLREFAWVEKFIREYTSKVPDPYREDYYNYSVAQLKYFQGLPGEAIDYLKSVSHGKQDIMFSFAVRKLLLRAAIESGEAQLIQEHIAAYKKHLERKKKDVGFYARLLRLFILYFERLFNSIPAQRQKIVEDLRSAENFAEKEWLLEMVKQKKL